MTDISVGPFPDRLHTFLGVVQNEHCWQNWFIWTWKPSHAYLWPGYNNGNVAVHQFWGVPDHQAAQVSHKECLPDEKNLILDVLEHVRPDIYVCNEMLINMLDK